jgi:hypothetical protein
LAGPPAAKGELLSAKRNFGAPTPVPTKEEAGKSLLNRWQAKRSSIPGSAEEEAKKDKAYALAENFRREGAKKEAVDKTKLLDANGGPCAKKEPTTSGRTRRGSLRSVS